jgi:hypothetical protein
VAITALSGLCFGLLVAVAVGVALTLFLVIYELDRLGVTELRATRDLSDVRLVGFDTAPLDGLLILRVDGPLYMANVPASTGGCSTPSTQASRRPSCSTLRLWSASRSPSSTGSPTSNGNSIRALFRCGLPPWRRVHWPRPGSCQDGPRRSVPGGSSPSRWPP